MSNKRTKRFSGFESEEKQDLINMLIGVKMDESGLVQAGSKVRDFFSSFASAGSAIIWFDRLAFAVENSFRRIDAALAFTSTIDLGKKVLGNSNYLGLATDRFQEFTLAMGSYGINMDDMMDGFVTLNERVQEFITGDAYVKEFTLGGFKQSDFTKDMDMVDQYLKVAEVMDKVAPNKRAFWASAVLGDQLNRTLGPMLSRGQLSVIQKMNTIRKSGLALDTRQLQILDKAAGAYKEVGNIFEGIRQDIAVDITDGLNGIIDYLLPDFYQLAVNIDERFKKISTNIRIFLSSKLR